MWVQRLIVPEPFNSDGGKLLHRFTSMVSHDCFMELRLQPVDHWPSTDVLFPTIKCDLLSLKYFRQGLDSGRT